ncbi:MAG: fumarate reductase flavoprotein subunit [Spirochaetes bacterium]|nr:MAG: fumarate reductase flavoprotein subunit [Spirochaetota bacterium]
MSVKKIKVFLVLLAVLAVAAFSSCQQVKESAKLETPAPAVITAMKPGVYKQTAKGMYDGLVVEVTLSEKKIEKVAVVEHKETPGIAAGAIETLPGKIVAAQSLSVDLVSGATMTSKGILAAVAQAISAAGGKAEEFKKPGADSTASAAASATSAASAAVDNAALPKKWDMEYDVVVVGGGFAGLSAAHSAATNGAKTVLVEKMPFVGGNSQINGGVYAAYTSKLAADFQKKLNLVPDTADAHIADTMKGGDYMSDIKLVRNMVYGSPFYLNMLLDNGLKVRESLTRPRW